MKDRSTLRLFLGGLLFGGCIAWFAWHGAWLAAVSLAGWFALLVIAARSRPRPGVRRYRVAPTVIAQEGAGVPWRSGRVHGAVQDASALEAAWIAAGLVVVRKRRRILVGLPGGEPAIVRIPRSGTFGGEPFEILSSDRRTVVMMLDVAARLLGDLRCRGDGEPGELRFYYVAAGPRAAA